MMTLVANSFQFLDRSGRRGHAQTASEIDWLLWQAGQELSPDAEPYHRTLTVFY